MLLDSQFVYSRHKFDAGKTRQKFHLTPKPKAELKRQRHKKVPLNLTENPEKLLAQSKDAYIVRKFGDGNEM